MIKMPRCRRGKNVVGLREGGVHHKHDPHGARLQPSLPALLSGNLDSGHSGVFFSFTLVVEAVGVVGIDVSGAPKAGRARGLSATIMVPTKRRGLIAMLVLIRNWAAWSGQVGFVTRPKSRPDLTRT